VADAAKIQQLVRRAWDEARPIDMGHLSEHDRVMVCDTIVDLIEAISPRLKTRTGRRRLRAAIAIRCLMFMLILSLRRQITT